MSGHGSGPSHLLNQGEKTWQSCSPEEMSYPPEELPEERPHFGKGRPLTLLTSTTTFPLSTVSRCRLATKAAARVFPAPVGSHIMIFLPSRAGRITSHW